MPIYLGSTPVSLKLGTQDVAGFLGDVAVTVIGLPAPVYAEAFSDGDDTTVFFEEVEGATGYTFYFDGVAIEPDTLSTETVESANAVFASLNGVGKLFQMAAIGPDGEGQKTPAVLVTAT